MKEVKVFTGISNIYKTGLESLIFSDDTCPKCGEHSLELETKEENEKQVGIRYKCSNCNYTCPITRDVIVVGEETIPRPGYDKTSISTFIDKFCNEKGF